MTHLELINAASARIMKSDALSYYEEILLAPALYREEYEQSKQYLHWLIEASEQDLLAYAKAEREWQEKNLADYYSFSEEYDHADTETLDTFWMEDFYYYRRDYSEECEDTEERDAWD